MSTLILCFHRIAHPDHGGRSLLAVSPEDFEKTLTEIGRSREFVTLEESSRPSSAQRAVVTFDDGYLDNLTAALPILESRGIPATFFLSTGFIDSDLLFPPDALDAVMEVPRVGISAGLENLIANGYWKALDTLASSPTDHYWRVLEDARDVVRDRVLAEDPTRRPLTLLEAKDLARSPMASIGPHTVSHRRLSHLKVEEALDEVEASVEWLNRENFDISPFFAYPYGQVADISPVLSAKIRDRGFEPLTTLPIVVTGRSRAIQQRWGTPRLSVGPSEIAQWSIISRLMDVFGDIPRVWLSLLALRRRARVAVSRFRAKAGKGIAW